jgi:hypothetical protein
MGSPEYHILEFEIQKIGQADRMLLSPPKWFVLSKQNYPNTQDCTPRTVVTVVTVVTFVTFVQIDLSNLTTP